LIERVGAEVARFQELANSVDTAAAAVLAIDRRDLPVMTLLLFQGPASPQGIAEALGTSSRETRNMIARLEGAGYVRRQSGAARSAVELTEHARDWIAQIWEPLREEGERLLSTLSGHELTVMAKFLDAANALQDRRAAQIRAQLDDGGARRSGHLRGGLSPAASRRVQVFVEANLDRSLQTADLAARAGLSAYHFARAFRRSMGMTPRAYVEGRRIARARTLIENTDRPLVEIAAQTGFSSQSRLTTAFRRLVGFTPATFRRVSRG
jgi:AraC family transcriptional regulator